MNRMLVRRPHARRRPPLAQLRRHFVDHLPHERRPAGELIEDRLDLLAVVGIVRFWLSTLDPQTLDSVHSTVTLFARFRGLSTSQPRRIAA